MPEGTCSLDECPRPAFARGWCQLHYYRQHRHGDPGEVQPYRTRKPLPVVACSVEDCDSRVRCQGFCRKHFIRWSKYGDPSFVQKAFRAPDSVCKVPDCGRPHDSRGWCKAHYARWRRWGDPLAPRRRGVSLAVRFWPKVDRRGDDECWPWLAARDRDGYGVLTSIRAHRVSWSIHHDDAPIPPGLVICHRCDNPPCVNPAHLFLGTYADNVRDMVRKGRNGRRPGHMLTQREVYELSLALAKEYQVSVTAASELICGVVKVKPHASDAT